MLMDLIDCAVNKKKKKNEPYHSKRKLHAAPLYIKFFPKHQILDSSKLKEFADDSFRFEENCKKLSKRVENTV